MKSFAFFLAACCSVLGAYAAEPVIELKLNEGSGTVVKDVSGAISGSIWHPENTKWVPGREENVSALFFTGEPKVARKGGALSLDLKSKVDFSKPFTVMFYFFVDKKLRRTSHSELVSCTGTEKGPGFRTLFSWNRLCFWIGDGKKRTELNTNPNKARVLRSVWNHAAFAYADGKAVIYLNGIKVAESANMLPVANGKNPLTIGSYSRGYAYNFHGALSDIKIFDRVFSDAEILSMVKDIK